MKTFIDAPQLDEILDGFVHWSSKRNYEWILDFIRLIFPSALRANGSARSLPGDALVQSDSHAVSAVHDARVLFGPPLPPLETLEQHVSPLLAEVAMSGSCAS